MQVSFREMVFEDIPAGLGLCRASRWNQTERDWAQFLEREPHGARVAVRDGRVIGTVTTIRYEARFGWIGMVLVDPRERGRGIGTQLLHEAVELLGDVGCARLDATPAGRAVYLKLGFQDEYGLVRMQRAPAAAPRVGENGVRPMQTRDLPAVLDLDRQVFGADRSALLQWLLAGAPEYARVIDAGGTLRGYSLGRHGFDFEQLGPIVAHDRKDAEALALACLAAAAPRPLILDAPSHSGQWLGWLAKQGFVEQRPFTRMWRGEHAHPGLPERQFAILGPEFG